MWELDCEEGWAPKNWCFWSVVLEKTLESPLDCKEIQPVHSEGDQPWDFFGSNDAKAETPVLWPRHAKSWLIGKDSDAGKDWWQEEKGMTEDDMAGWHHWLDGRGSGWTPGVGDGQGRPGVLWFMESQRSRHDWATELNWTELKTLSLYCLKCVSFALFLIPIFPGCRISSWVLFSLSTLKAYFYCFVASFVITKKSAQFLSFFKGHLSVHSGAFLSPQFHCYTLRSEFFPNEILWY